MNDFSSRKLSFFPSNMPVITESLHPQLVFLHASVRAVTTRSFTLQTAAVWVRFHNASVPLQSRSWDEGAQTEGGGGQVSKVLLNPYIKPECYKGQRILKERDHFPHHISVEPVRLASLSHSNQSSKPDLTPD